MLKAEVRYINNGVYALNILTDQQVRVHEVAHL